MSIQYLSCILVPGSSVRIRPACFGALLILDPVEELKAPPSLCGQLCSAAQETGALPEVTGRLKAEPNLEAVVTPAGSGPSSREALVLRLQLVKVPQCS